MLTDFKVVNIKTTLAEGKAGEEYLRRVCANFSCPMNFDVEHFFRNNAIDFTKRNQSVSYLVVSHAIKKTAGYFALAIKPISVNASMFSNTVRRKIERVSEVNEQTGEYILAAYLIAQLGKNFKDGANKLITGEQLLDLALDAIRELQFRAGCTVVFLEADDNPKLLSFYEANGFKQFAVRQRHSPDQHKLVQLLRVL